MPQILTYHGFRVSGHARQAEDNRWHAWYLIERDCKLIRKSVFMLSSCSISTAEALVLTHGLKYVDEWVEQPAG